MPNVSEALLFVGMISGTSRDGVDTALVSFEGGMPRLRETLCLPLAPLLHRALFKPESGTRVILNLGGIANISILNSGGSVSGFDTGPANCLLDGWIREQRGEPYDREGAWSTSTCSG